MSWRSKIRNSLAYVIVAVAGFMLAYLVAAFVVFPSGGIIPEDATVPAVVGMTYDQAATELRRAGFQAAEGETRFHASVPKGTVLEQEPAAGAKEMMGTKVTLAVSGGQATQPVPNTIGMTRETAEQTIEQAGFTVSGIEERASQQPVGEVIDSRPRPGTSATVPGSVVLILSSGPSLVSTPDVTGLSVPQARQLLTAAGLAVGDIAYEYAPGGTIVMTQSPAPGTQVPQGTRVSLRAVGEVAP